MTTRNDIAVLASGRIAFVGPDGRATLDTCGWLVDVPTASLYPPEAEWYPDSPADVYTAVPCEAPVYAIDYNDPDAGWFCSNGHRHLTYGSAAQQAEEAREALVESMASSTPWIAARLDAGESYDRIMNSVA